MKKLIGLRAMVQVDGLTCSLEGKIIATGDDLIMIDARAIENGKATPIDGRVLIPRHRVVWVQVP